MTTDLHPSRRARGPLTLLACISLACLAGGCDPGDAGDGSGTGGAGQNLSGRGFVAQNPTGERELYHDLGELEEGEVVGHTFELLNTDPDPITIRSITPACVCTLGRVYYHDGEGRRVDGRLRDRPVLVVPPGAVAHVEIRLESSHVPRKNLDHLMVVRMICDSPNRPYLTFELHTKVLTPLQATPRQLDLGEIPTSVGGRATTTLITAEPESPVIALGVGEKSEGLEVEMVQMDPDAPEAVWFVTVAVPPGLPLGAYEGFFHVRVSGYDGEGEGRPFRVSVRAQVVEDVVLQPRVLAFPAAHAGGGFVARAVVQALVPGERVRVTNASVTGELADELRVEFEPLEADTTGRSPSWAVRITAPPELAGETFVGTLRVELDHELVPEVTGRYVYARAPAPAPEHVRLEVGEAEPGLAIPAPEDPR